MATDPLAEYVSRPLERPSPEVLEAIRRGPIDPAAALPAADVDRLGDPALLEAESGWCTLEDGVGQMFIYS